MAWKGFQRIIWALLAVCAGGIVLLLLIDGLLVIGPVDGAEEGILSVEERPQGPSSSQDAEGSEAPAPAERQAGDPDLDFFYQNPVTRPYADIRTLGEDYDKWQAQTDMCFVIGAMVHNDCLYYEFMEHCQNQEDAFIRVVQDGTGERDIVIDDILYDSGAGKIYLVHDAARDNLAAEAEKTIMLYEFDGTAEYRYNGHLYWIAFNGEMSEIELDSDEVFVITLIN